MSNFSKDAGHMISLITWFSKLNLYPALWRLKKKYDTKSEDVTGKDIEQILKSLDYTVI